MRCNVAKKKPAQARAFLLLYEVSSGGTTAAAFAAFAFAFLVVAFAAGTFAAGAFTFLVVAFTAGTFATGAFALLVVAFTAGTFAAGAFTLAEHVANLEAGHLERAFGGIGSVDRTGKRERTGERGAYG
jgi:hypothetical protein